MWLVHTLEEIHNSYAFDTTGPDFEFPDAITKIVVVTSPPWGVLPRTPHDKSLPVSDIEALARKFKALYDKADKQYQSWKRSLLSEAAESEKLGAYVRGLPVAISMNVLLHLPHHLAPLYQPQLVKEGFVVCFSFICFWCFVRKLFYLSLSYLYFVSCSIKLWSFFLPEVVLVFVLILPQSHGLCVVGLCIFLQYSLCRNIVRYNLFSHHNFILMLTVFVPAKFM